MSYRSILVPLSWGLMSGAPLDAAKALAGRFGSEVTVFLPLVDPQQSVVYVGEGATHAVIETLMDATEKENVDRRERAQSLFKTHLGDGARTRLEEQTGRDTELVAHRARLADLVITAQPDDGASLEESALEAVLYEGGHGLLIVPDTAGSALDTPVGHAVVAWNDTPEAARAVSAALPLLAETAKVTIVSDAGNAKQVQAYLDAHGITAGTAQLDIPDGLFDDKTGEAILSVTGELGAELIVMGAFSHSRLHRLILGGATKTVMRKARVPVLMAH